MFHSTVGGLERQNLTVKIRKLILISGNMSGTCPVTLTLIFSCGRGKRDRKKEFSHSWPTISKMVRKVVSFPSLSHAFPFNGSFLSAFCVLFYNRMSNIKRN